ncbi:Adrenodoxin reductase:NAD-dependent glycerol-3-phosphate dehydrogenase [Fulvimarina pelagi HTCC2506]|uniref:Glycerol-3-phosphate dehydrogenase [NAD(P)+] n=1 Tax=Fulvimarina pelagi HTCC2506 TaxID=314231 RepID=Q0G4B1_9HYPH|nr:NAD(P)H-dependent glycerol-3-phosphate dehydrogenase [Fulvimarina pelagi]EAU41570.1 Adrenodoxin reductase:NAD-dependent glycerol-3-phosphate dehydrogenase [Fulvimarina pelagi HTCC2506]
MTRFTVIGAGAWGTALANLYARADHDVVLLGRNADAMAAMEATRRNEGYLPDVYLPPALRATHDAKEALSSAEVVLFVVPAQSLATAAETYGDLVPSNAMLVLCAKGIERRSGRFSSAIMAERFANNPLCVLSGPSFAADVANGLPTAVTVAAGTIERADRAAELLSANTFRCYASDDLAGVEAGGALKNVLALAAGMAIGRGLGESAKAAIVTRGFVELRRLGAAFGGQPQTLMGLSGLGDLILTCSSEQSRNFAYGIALGSGVDRTNLKLAEGVYSAGIAARLARERQIEAPIVQAVAEILDGEISIDEAMHALLSRPLRREVETA